MRTVIAALIATQMGLVACKADERARSPDDVLRSYAEALRAGDAERAYSLLSADAKRELPFPAFERMLKENPAEMRRISDSLAGDTELLQVEATVTAVDGETLHLVLEDGHWRATAESVDLYGQASPEQALYAFVRAFEAKRYDVLLRFVPLEQSSGLDEAKLKAAWEGPERKEMEALVSGLKSALPSADVEELAGRATVGYGAGATVLMLREAGLWKIEEFENAAYSPSAPNHQ